MKRITMILATVAMFATGQLATAMNVENEISEKVLNVEESVMLLDYYHIKLWDDDCGWIVFDGWVNWNDMGGYDSFCVDITSDNCGDHHVSGLVMPGDLTDPRGNLTKSSIHNYIMKVYQL